MVQKIELQKEYREAVEIIANVDVFHIDPNRFMGIMQHDLIALNMQWLEQYPEQGDTISLNSDNIYMEELIEQSILGDPWAIIKSDLCIVNGINETYQDRYEFVSNSIGYDIQFLKPVPGEDSDYVTDIGAHEGQHCNQLNIKRSGGDRLAAETEAISVALDYNSSSLKVVEVLVDLRKANPWKDPKHASGIQLEDQSIITEHHADKLFIQASISGLYLNSNMNEILDPADTNLYTAQNLELLNPELYFDLIDFMLEAGEFSYHPILEKYIKAHSEAIQNRVYLDRINPEGAVIDTDIELNAAEYIDAVLLERYQNDKELGSVTINPNNKTFFQIGNIEDELNGIGTALAGAALKKDIVTDRMSDRFDVHANAVKDPMVSTENVTAPIITPQQLVF